MSLGVLIGRSPSQPWVSQEGGILTTGDILLGEPLPGPRPLACPLLPGIVLSTTDQDFMVQKPPEGKGEWRPFADSARAWKGLCRAACTAAFSVCRASLKVGRAEAQREKEDHLRK